MEKELRKKCFSGLFLSLFALQVAAQGNNITLKCDQASLPSTLYQVERLSGYYKVNYNYDLLKDYKVSADIKGLPAPKAIEVLLASTPYTVQVDGSRIMIVRKSKQTDAERRKVSGQILDTYGNPLIGVSVKVVGSKKGAVTDDNGEYSMEGIPEDAKLEYAYIGMKTFQRKVSYKHVTIIMEDDSKLLNDVVVTGYQTLKKENATGAFQVISSKDINDRYMSDLQQSLEGKIAGLVNYDNGNTSGLTIRGVSSLKASTSPLIVVDGLPINGTLDDVNKYEVDKITVLKDAAAAAIYGARASNGVIVITTKKAQTEKLSIDFNADVTTTNKLDYGSLDYCNASELMELEQYNFDWITKRPDAINYLLKQYDKRGRTMNPMTQLMIKHYKGELSDAEYNSTIQQWSKNDYQKEWQDLMLHNRLQQQYNLSVRTKGKYLNSSIIVDWHGDNTNMKSQFDNTLSMQYVGKLDAAKWLDMDFGVTLNNTRSKNHTSEIGEYNKITDFYPYQSMYNADGTPARLRAGVALDEPSLSDASLGLKDEGFSPVNELFLNYEKSRETYTRSYIHANLKPIDGLKLSGMFQYEDISGRSEKLLDGDSYIQRHYYNLFTYKGKHYIPEGGCMTVNSNEGNYLTFRAQATYDKTFAEKHAVSAIAGYEYRQTFSRSTYNQMWGYDEQTLTNSTGLIDFSTLGTLKSTDLGTLYSPEYYFSASDVAGSTHIKHRYKSYYATANYTYDSRYSLSASYRVDKADLFGADPKFRSRPLWSVGLGWNLNKEAFLKDAKWLDMLKMRFSYGVTGNINSNYSSYLTAKIRTNSITGVKKATLNTPPNDQLRWEKTTSWDWGFDFSVLNHRLTGSFDLYHKKSSDVLANIDLDPTTGWSSLYTNNAETLNKGLELQLSAEILKAKSRDDIGLSLDMTLAHNKNKILKLHHVPTSGLYALESFHEGDPVNSLYSFAFDHFETDEDGYQQLYWKKADGTVSNDDIYNSTFTVDDVKYCGSLDPTWTGSFTPTITWKGFSLSGSFVWYAGHYFRSSVDEWSTRTSYSYSAATPRAYLNYWRTSESERQNMLGNGYMNHDMYVPYYNMYYCDQTVDHADYMKLRTLTLGYRFAPNVCKALRIQGLSLRLQMTNVLTWVRNKKGIDPERVSPIEGTVSPKIPKSYTLSLNVNF